MQRPFHRECSFWHVILRKYCWVSMTADFFFWDYFCWPLSWELQNLYLPLGFATNLLYPHNCGRHKVPRCSNLELQGPKQLSSSSTWFYTQVNRVWSCLESQRKSWNRKEPVMRLLVTKDSRIVIEPGIFMIQSFMIQREQMWLWVGTPFPLRSGSRQPPISLPSRTEPVSNLPSWARLQIGD